MTRTVLTVAVPVSDLARASQFLSEAAGFAAGPVERFDDAAWDTLLGLEGASHAAVTMRLGDESLRLVQFDRTGRALPSDSRSNDLWFQHVAIVVSDMACASARLDAGRLVSAAPQTIPESNPDAAGVKACYFLDPDRHVLELIWFPDGKGQARWQRGGGALHLGIDHTAIAVRDTARSLCFYRDGLGLREVGHSHNVGLEQARLSGVTDADVRITALHGEGGIGIEFLEYLHPLDGRAAPPSLAGNDLGHVTTFVRCDDPVAAVRALADASACAVSRPVAFPAGAAPFRTACLVRDPDGHAIILTD